MAAQYYYLLPISNILNEIYNRIKDIFLAVWGGLSLYTVNIQTQVYLRDWNEDYETKIYSKTRLL